MASSRVWHSLACSSWWRALGCRSRAQLMGRCTSARECVQYVHLDLPISAKRAAGDLLRLTASLILDTAP